MNRKSPSTTDTSPKDPPASPLKDSGAGFIERDARVVDDDRLRAPAAGFRIRGEAIDVNSPSVTTDDFQRLGVQPQECRLTVIRRAAARSTKTIAKRQLDEPTDGGDAQLSQVATSAYRLMDPRFRIDSFQRAYVGRILPNAMMWAGRTRFAVGDEPPTASPSNGQVTPEVMDDGEPFIDLESDVPSLATGLDLGSSLTQSLDADDLINPGWMTRSGRWVHRMLRKPSVGLTVLACSLLMATYLAKAVTHSLVARNENDESIIEDVDDGVAVQETVHADQAGSLETQGSLVPRTPEAEFASDANVESDTLPLESPEMLAEPSGESAETSDSEDAEQLGNLLDGPDGTAGTMVGPVGLVESPVIPKPEPAVDPSFDPIAEPAIVAADAGSDSAVDSKVDADNGSANTVPDLPLVEDPFDQVDREMAAGDVSEKEPAALAKPTRFPQPDSAEVAEARRRIIHLIPQLDGVIRTEQLSEILRELDDVQQSLTPGDAEDWASGRLRCELAWLTGDSVVIKKTIQSLAAYEAFDKLTCMGETFTTVPDFVDSRDVHVMRFRMGARLLDKLLIDQRIKLAKQVVVSLRPTVDFLNDDRVTQEISVFDDAITQMGRQQLTASRVEGMAPAEISESEAGVTGRYFCLMLRDWKKGLPLLALGNDQRFAGLARQELELGDAIGVKESAALADRWLALAKRMPGRDGQSIRLHALELMQSKLQSTDGLDRLELERAIETLSDELPFYFAPEIDTTQRGVSPASAVSKTASPIVQASNLTGRMRLDSVDQGVQIRYQPPMAITNQIVGKIGQALGRDVESCEFHFEGSFSQASDRLLRITVSKPDENLAHRVLIDGNQVGFNGLRSIEIPVPAGDHRLVWQVKGTSFSGAFVDVKDASTDQPLQFTPAYELSPTDQPTKLTIDMISAKAE